VAAAQSGGCDSWPASSDLKDFLVYLRLLRLCYGPLRSDAALTWSGRANPPLPQFVQWQLNHGKIEPTLELVTAQSVASCNPAEQRKF